MHTFRKLPNSRPQTRAIQMHAEKGKDIQPQYTQSLPMPLRCLKWILQETHRQTPSQTLHTRNDPP